MVEGGAPNALVRRGWNRNSVPAGIKVHVEGFQARDRSFRASGRTITLPDGHSLFMGSTGLGAPGASGGAEARAAARATESPPALLAVGRGAARPLNLRVDVEDLGALLGRP